MAEQEKANRRAAVTAWLSLLGVLGVVWGLVWWGWQVPAPLGPDVPAGSFSEARAMAIDRKLADEIGPHPIGSQTLVEASNFLAEELRKIPRLEVEIQEVEGDNCVSILPHMTAHFRARNVLARLPGRSKEAILLDAHFDSPAESPGAGDNGRGTAVAFEAMRALAAGPELERTVILLLADGEEVGDLGAAGFLKHPWAKDVSAYISLDGSGRGKAILMMSSSDYPALLGAFARVAPGPQASAFFDDVFRSGAMGQTGDYEPFNRAGLPGLFFAGIGDTAGVHTQLDVTSRLEPGAMQHEGEIVLSVARELASSAAPIKAGPRSVYFDVLGVVTVVYTMGTARVLALLALITLAAALVVLRKRQPEITPAHLGRAFGWSLLAMLAGLVSSIAAMALVAVALGRPHGWYSAPWLVAPAFGGAGLAGVAGVHTLWRRRSLARGLSPEASALLAWMTALVFWGFLLALSALAAVGVGYLALLWVLPSSLALLVGFQAPRWRWPLWLASVAIGAMSFLSLAAQLPGNAGMASYSFDSAPRDPMLAMFFWGMVVFPLSPFALAGMHRIGGLGRAAQAFLAIALVGLAITALRSPYDSFRRKRILATHQEQDGKTALILATTDAVPLAQALAAIPEASPVPEGERLFHALLPGFPVISPHALPAGPLSAPPPRVELLSSSQDAPGVRTLKLRLHGGGHLAPSERELLFLEIPHQTLVGWSLEGRLPEPLPGQSFVYAFYAAPSPNGQELTLQLKGEAPTELSLYEVRSPANTPELTALQQRMPNWTAFYALALQTTKVKF